MRFSRTAREYGLHTYIYICTKLREYRDEEISQEGTVDDLSVTLTIHLLNDMKAYKRKEVGSISEMEHVLFFKL